MDELAAFGLGERLAQVAAVRIAGGFVDWAGPAAVNSYRNLFALASNIAALDICVDQKFPHQDSLSEAPLAPHPALTSLDIRGHLSHPG